MRLLNILKKYIFLKFATNLLYNLITISTYYEDFFVEIYRPSGTQPGSLVDILIFAIFPISKENNFLYGTGTVHFVSLY